MNGDTKIGSFPSSAEKLHIFLYIFVRERKINISIISYILMQLEPELTGTYIISGFTYIY
jgi:hypothetical protein